MKAKKQNGYWVIYEIEQVEGGWVVKADGKVVDTAQTEAEASTKRMKLVFEEAKR